ncbi:hypothetical protein H6503_00165 [Candidatus Woesearchaeota archaeon]|nr:hypothetical protein [Candidatus Woesearchaeota archaeon]
MVSVQEALNILDDDSIFKEWKSQSPDSYLCHCLKMLDDEDAWHVGYCNKDSTITTFIVSSSAVEKQDAEEAFKHPDSTILPLIEQDIAITGSQAMDLAEDFSKKEYPRDPISKSLVVLQALEIGQVYNITFITIAMSTINIKVSSKTGEILEHKKTSLMDFRMDDKDIP